MKKPQKSRIYSNQEKLDIVLRTLVDGIQVNEIAKEYGITRESVYVWRRQFFAKAQTIFESTKTKGNAAVDQKIFTRVQRENTLLKKLLEHYKRTRKRV
jgi:transposase-like protein